MGKVMICYSATILYLYLYRGGISWTTSVQIGTGVLDV